MSAQPQRSPGAARVPDSREPRCAAAPLRSDELLRGQRVVEIVHNGEVYRLQATRLGKLILTK